MPAVLNKDTMVPVGLIGTGLVGAIGIVWSIASYKAQVESSIAVVATQTQQQISALGASIHGDLYKLQLRLEQMERSADTGLTRQQFREWKRVLEAKNPTLNVPELE